MALFDNAAKSVRVRPPMRAVACPSGAKTRWTRKMSRAQIPWFCACAYRKTGSHFSGTCADWINSGSKRADLIGAGSRPIRPPDIPRREDSAHDFEALTAQPDQGCG